MADYPDDFSNYPRSVQVKRADADPNGADIWSARDVLIETLRQIDNGTLKDIECLFVGYLFGKDQKDKEGGIGFKQHSPTLYLTLGMLEGIKELMLRKD